MHMNVLARYCSVNRRDLACLFTGDCAMADGMDAERVVRVGFLNVPSRRETFEGLFDVVLDGEAGLEYPISVLQYIASRK